VYLSELDGGIYSAMNKGWELAPLNSFVFYLNARDIFASNDSLANANLELQAHGNPPWGCTTHEEINRDGSGWICKLVSQPNIRNQLFAYGYRSHQAVVMKASLIHELGGFNEKYQIAADWDLIVRAILHSKPAEWKKPLAVFELGGESSMKMISAHRELMELRKIYLPTTVSMVFHEYLWRAIYLQQFGYVNVFTPILKFALAINSLKCFLSATRKIFKPLKPIRANKGKKTINSLKCFLLAKRKKIKPLQLFSGKSLIGYLHERLNLKPLK
jgi:hypothetical protein